MKNIFFSKWNLILLIPIGFLLNSCQKEINVSAQEDETGKLSINQLELKKRMDQAAQIIARFSDEKEVQDEIAELIRKRDYCDDYVKFKDLFQPEENSELKSVSVTRFAKKFRSYSTENNKGSNEDDFDLEKYLVENNLVLYVPYPLEDYPEGMRTPTITFHPLTNDSVNIGYVLSNSKGIQQITQVDDVGEGCSEKQPVYIIEPEGYLDDGADGGAATSGSENSNVGSHLLVKLVHMQVRKQYDVFLNGGSEIRTVFADAVVTDASKKESKINKHYNGVLNFSRKEIRKMKKDPTRWKNINIILDPDWKEDELENYIGMVEEDVVGSVTLGLKATVKISASVSLTPSLSYTIKSTHDFIGEREMPRDFFLASEKNHSLESGTFKGKVIRKMNSDVSITTEISYY